MVRTLVPLITCAGLRIRNAAGARSGSANAAERPNAGGRRSARASPRNPVGRVDAAVANTRRSDLARSAPARARTKARGTTGRRRCDADATATREGGEVRGIADLHLRRERPCVEVVGRRRLRTAPARLVPVRRPPLVRRRHRAERHLPPAPRRTDDRRQLRRAVRAIASPGNSPATRRARSMRTSTCAWIRARRCAWARRRCRSA